MAKYKANIGVVITRFLVIATIVATALAIPAWAGKGQGSGITALSDAEVFELTYMREEEKLARDVYLLMYDLWSADIFNRIATSEQRHMNTMKRMLDKYGLPDPAEFTVEGEFIDPGLQAKYDWLIDEGDNSYFDGLYVGATIEEIDMIDLQHAIDITTHVDVAKAYQNLLDGSKYHLRAYVKALDVQLGFTYEPQHISEDLYNEIIGYPDI